MTGPIRAPRRPSSGRTTGRWWRLVLWTVLGVASLNLLLGYLVAQAVWPARVPQIAQPALLGLALATAAFLLIAASGWAGYLRARR